MNKKLLFGLFAAVSMLFATSCSQEEPCANLGNEGTVTFKVKQDAPRAFGNAAGVDHIVWEVYDAEGNKIQALSGHEEAFNGTLEHQIDFKLAKGQTYSFAFFAYSTASGDAYNVSDLKNIKISYDGITSQLENRDAFFGSVVNHFVEGNFEKEVVLRRPFAQLNFGVEKSEWEAAITAGSTIAQSKVLVSEVASSFNALDGTVSGSLTDVEFALADLPTEDLLVDLKNDGTKEAYKYLSMNYILPYDATTGYNSTSNNVTFTFTTNAADIVFDLPNTPLQRNWRTNVIGSLVSTGEFKIVIDTVFAGEYNDGTAFSVTNKTTNLRYQTIADALAAANAGDVIALAADTYALPTNLKLKDGATGTITFVGEGENTIINGSHNANSGAPGNKAEGLDLVFQNLKHVTANNSYNGGFGHAASVSFENCTIIGQFYAHSGAPHTFTNCTIDPLNGYLYTYGVNCTFEGCTFESSEGKALQVYAEAEPGVESTVTINNCTFTAAKEAKTYSGDPVTAIDINSIRGNKFNVVITNTTATGYGTGKYSGSDLWNIKGGAENVTISLADGVAFSNGAYELSNAAGMTWFANQVNAEGYNFAGQTLKLANDIDLKNATWIPVGQTGGATFKGVFDGQNYTISNLHVDSDAQTGENYASGLFGWLEQGGPVVKNVKVDGATIKGHHYVAAIAGYVYGTIENCHVKNATISCVSANADANGDKCGTIAGYVGEDATIKDCTAADSKIDAGRDAGQIVGAAKEACVTDCSATNVTVTANGSSTGANINEAVIGRVL